MSKSEERCQNCQVSALEERVSLYHGEQTVFEKKADHCARDSNQRSVWMRKFSLFDGLSRKINPWNEETLNQMKTYGYVLHMSCRCRWLHEIRPSRAPQSISQVAFRPEPLNKNEIPFQVSYHILLKERTRRDDGQRQPLGTLATILFPVFLAQICNPWDSNKGGISQQL